MLLICRSPRYGCCCRYTDYLLEALRRRELFQWIRLAPTKFWHTLLLRDRFNFLGLLAPVEQHVRDRMTQQPGALSQVCAACT